MVYEINWNVLITVLCLRAMHNKLHHVGIQSKVSKSTLADANEKRDWRIYCDFAQLLIGQARKLYADDDFGLQLEETVYVLDASTIDLCRSVFPWALFRSTKSGIKLHTLLNLRGNIPSFVSITDAKIHDVNIICAGRHHEKALEAWTEPLHNFTDFKYYSFWEKSYFMGIYRK